LNHIPGIARFPIVCDYVPVKQLQPPDSHNVVAADGWIGLGNWQAARAELEKITSDSQGNQSPS
jgi:hypothetical protein